MIRRLGQALERFFRTVTPDPFVLAILLTALTAVLAVAWTPAGPREVLDAWQGPRGFWGLLSFSMQMCLVLVTGHALASAPVVKRGITWLVARPKTPAGAGALVAFVAVSTSFVNWGLALIVGALLARDMGRACRRRGIRAHYPLLVAAGYTGLMTWHGGFSGSAPLKVTRRADLVELLGPDLGARIDPVSTFQTLLGPMNLVVSVGLLLLVPTLVALMTPKAGDEVSEASLEADEPTFVAPRAATTVPERLERSPYVMAVLAVPLVAYLVLFYGGGGLGRLDPNAVNLTLLTAGLILHGSPRAYGNAVSEAVSGCAGIIVQFPLYGGIMGIMAATGLGKLFAGWAIAAGSKTAYLLLTFFTSGLINLFVPSGGGQWAIQGPVAAEAAIQLGVPLESAVMAVAYGDQWTNMLQPFWALPLLGITGVRARDIIGYTATIMLISGLWFGLGLVTLG